MSFYLQLVVTIIYDTRADRPSFNVIKKTRSLGFGHKLQDTGDTAEQKQMLQGAGETQVKPDRTGGMNQDNQDNQIGDR